MTHQNFNELTETTFEKIRKLSEGKGKEYSSTEDRLSNFKDISKETGVSELAVWSVYSKKHGRAIDSYIRNGNVFSEESIEARIIDRILYDILLLGLIEDQRSAEQRSAEKISTLSTSGETKPK
jgi:hypothetical protein